MFLPNPTPSMITAPITARSARGAFTLIELLTVIAIIGILAAIIIPTVGRVRETARASNCASNLRQIGMALKLYVDDNKGLLPEASRPFDAARGDTGGGSTVPWTKALGPYLPRRGTTTTARVHSIFICPSADFNGKSGQELGSTYTATGAMIGLGASGTATGSAVNARSLSKIDTNRHSLIPLIMEGKASSPTATDANSNRNWGSISADLAATKPSDAPNFDFRHNGRMNVAYVDGSVRSMDLVAFKTLDVRTYSGLPLQ